MNKKLIYLICVFVMMFMLAAPALAQAPVASVNTGNLNVRSGPGLEYGAVATLPQGFGVSLVARNEAASWVFISLTNGVTGWVNVNYLFTNYRIWDLPVNETVTAAPLTPTGTVTGALHLNVRVSPSDQAEVIGTIGLNQSFELLGRNFNATWAQIRLPDGTVGWVGAGFINTSVPVRSVSPTDGSVAAPVPPGGVPGSGQSGGGGRIHTVVAGDTLAKISQRYGVSMYRIAAANNILNLNLIYRGQRLVIPS